MGAKLFLGLVGMLLMAYPNGASAQSMGASSGFQIRAEAGKAINSTQLYIRQRGIGWLNLGENIQFSSGFASSSAGLIDIPVPSVVGPLPEDFRLSITSSDQVLNTLTTVTSSVTSVTLTSAPVSIPSR